MQPCLPAPPNVLLLGLCELVTCSPSGPRAARLAGLTLPPSPAGDSLALVPVPQVMAHRNSSGRLCCS